MLNNRLVLSLAVLAVTAIAVPSLAGSATSTPLIFFQLSNGSFMMSADSAEIQVIPQTSGTARAAQFGYVFWTQVPGTVPLYRYRSHDTGDHFFTTSLDEGNTAVAQYGYTPENICCYIYTTPVPGSLPLYRAARGSFHFYTVNSTERQQFIAGQLGGSGQARDEGIVGYVLSSQKQVNY